MKVINLIGAASTGKSTTVYGLLYFMKRLGLNVEYASEYAKDLVWEKQGNVLQDQLYILAKQHRKLLRLEGVDYAITDTSLLLCIPYAGLNPMPELVSVIKAHFNLYDNETFYLPRNDNFKYRTEGRSQGTVEEADALTPAIEAVLPENTIRLAKSDDYVMPILEHLGLASAARELPEVW